MTVGQPDVTITEYNGLEIGDMITAYHKGYHVIVGFAPYCGNGAMQVYYKTVADSKGNPRGGKIRNCHNSYCKIVDIKRLEADREWERMQIRLKYNTLINICRELAHDNSPTS